MRQPRIRHRRGFTLTELAIVLGVIGMVTAGVWSAASIVLQRQKVNDQISEIKTVADNIRATYSAAKTFPMGYSDITAQLIDANIIPSYMKKPGSSPSSALNVEGGDLQVYVISGSQFQINVGTTAATCQAVSAYFAGLADDLGIPGIYYNISNTFLNPVGNGLDVTSFAGCTYTAIQFSLHPG